MTKKYQLRDHHNINNDQEKSTENVTENCNRKIKFNQKH